jgi:hypothetical protein
MDALSNDKEIFDIDSLDWDLDLSISIPDNEMIQENQTEMQSHQDNNEHIKSIDDSTRNHFSISMDGTNIMILKIKRKMPNLNLS